jgi:hypothetical protein
MSARKSKAKTINIIIEEKEEEEVVVDPQKTVRTQLSALTSSLPSS